MGLVQYFPSPLQVLSIVQGSDLVPSKCCAPTCNSSNLVRSGAEKCGANGFNGFYIIGFNGFSWGYGLGKLSLSHSIDRRYFSLDYQNMI